MIAVELNGERVELEPGATVGDAVRRSGAPESERGVAVAVDGEVVPRGEWATTAVRNGQKIEVVTAIQGG